MSRLTWAMVALLRCLARLLPADRREWAHALWAEAEEVPAGWLRLVWLAGGVRLTVREAALVRRFGLPLVFVAAAGGTAWSAWSGPSGDTAIVINRVDVITIAVILAVLPWAIRRARGPVASGLMARLVRTGGYATVLALVLVKTAVERVADAPPNNVGGSARDWIGEVIFLAVMAGYGAVILAFTARRSPAPRATVVTGTAIGAVMGILAYALGPLGFPLRFTGTWPAGLYDAAIVVGALLALCAPVAAGLAATRRAGRSLPAGPGWRQGAMAGLCTGATAALVVAVLSTATIALLPYASGLEHWAAGHIGHWAPVASSGESYYGYGQMSRIGYVAGNSAFAAGYLIVLLVGPLFGCAFGASAGRAGAPGHRPRLPGGGLPMPSPASNPAAGSSPASGSIRRSRD